jgi:hypothetical protein
VTANGLALDASRTLATKLLKGFTRETIAEAAANIDCWTVINGLLKSKSERTRLETLIFCGTGSTSVQRRAFSILAGCFMHTWLGDLW